MILPTFIVLAVTLLNVTVGPRTNEAPKIVLALKVPGTFKSPFKLLKYTTRLLSNRDILLITLRIYDVHPTRGYCENAR
jgi:hypothetical protein